MTDDTLRILKELAAELHDGISLAVRTGGGSVMLAQGRGIMPLWEIYSRAPHALKGAMVADKVIGLGAAALMAAAGVSAAYAPAVSRRAYDFMRTHGIDVAASSIAPFIINRAGTGQCPLESLLEDKEESGYLDEITAFVNNIIKGKTE